MVVDIFANFTTRDFVILLGIGLAQIPFLIMLNYFRHSGIKDFLFGALIMFCGSVSLLFTQFFFLEIKIIYIIANSCFLITYFLLFIHSIRYKWDQPPRIIYFSGIILFGLIELGILLYSVVPIDPIETTIFHISFQGIDRKTGTIPEIAAIFTINGQVVIGSAFLYLIDLYRLLVSVLFFYVYYTTKLSYETPETIRNRKIILVVAILNMLHPILITLVGLKVLSLPYIIFNLINMLFISLLAYIGIFHPQTLSLSHVQVIRTLSLYKVIEKQENTNNIEKGSNFSGMNSLMSYIEKISEKQK